MDWKVCRVCGKRKRALYFVVDNGRVDGRGTQCLECADASGAAWRERNREKLRAVNRSRRAAEVLREKASREKWTGRQKLLKAVASGRVVKPSRCEDCSMEKEARFLYGYHARGWSDPLDVVWLCPSCTGKRRRKHPRSDADLLSVVDPWAGEGGVSDA